MKKSELRSGMLLLVKDDSYECEGYKNGVWHVLIDDKTYELINKPYNFCYLSLDDFDENLKYIESDSSWKIEKIAEVSELTFVFRHAKNGEDIETVSGFKVIWQRDYKKPETINITINTIINAESVKDVEKVINELQEKLNNLKINLTL